MTCTSETFQLVCRINKVYIGSGDGGRYYHGDFCQDCIWWEDTDEDKEYWDKLEKLGIKRRVK